jgi:hypothetical protein
LWEGCVMYDVVCCVWDGEDIENGGMKMTYVALTCTLSYDFLLICGF